MSEDHLESFRRRARNEREAASKEQNPDRREAHERLADQYDRVVASYEEAERRTSRRAEPRTPIEDGTGKAA